MRHYLPLVFLIFLIQAGWSSEKSTKLSPSEIFPPKNGRMIPLQGRIVNGRYHSPEEIFTCDAYDFGEGRYLAQDALLDCAVCVGFYNSTGRFKRAEVLFFPGNEDEKIKLKEFSLGFALGILKDVDNAQGIDILSEEMIEDDMYFVAMSIEKMDVLTDGLGRFIASTRGYLAFQERDKVVVLSNQQTTLPGQKHTPQQHIEALKKDILNFRKTFAFRPSPVPQKEETPREPVLPQGT